MKVPSLAGKYRLAVKAALLLLLFRAGLAPAQTLNEDDRDIPLDADLTAAAASSGGNATSSLKMGLYIESTSNNSFLIRDIASGEKSGFEYDNSSLYTKANWWFWGDLSPRYHLDAEIGVWEIDHALYQANSWGGNDPDVSWKNGLSSLGGMFFAPLEGFNSQTPGLFNKMAFTIKTPAVNTRAGYGLLKENTMTGFTGIYNVIDPWEDVGKGFLELSLGDSVKNADENIRVDALAALSRMRAQYGIYSLFKASFYDKADAALTFTSASSSLELSDYGDDNDNAASVYAAWRPMETLKLSVHGLSAFGTAEGPGIDAMAGAAGAEFNAGAYRGSLTQSFAGEKARSVWGDDDAEAISSGSLTPDASLTSLYQRYEFNRASAGLDADFRANKLSAPDEGLWNLRLQPIIGFNMNESAGVSAYGVINIDRIAKDADSDQPWSTYFKEAGVELTLDAVHPLIKKMLFDYAFVLDYNDWTHADGYKLDTVYHSFMLSYEANDALSATLAALLRSKTEEDKTLVPFGCAAGISLKTGIKSIGSPQVWWHFVYAMDPYEDNNYTLYRYDDPDNNLKHPSYRLNSLYENVTKSRVSFGLIWNL